MITCRCIVTFWSTKVAIENGLIEIVDLPMKNGGSFQFVFCTRLPEGMFFFEVPVSHQTIWGSKNLDLISITGYCFSIVFRIR